MSAGQSFSVNLLADADSRHDPTGNAAGIILNTFTWTGAMSASQFSVQSANVVNGNVKAFGRHLAVNIQATQGAAGPPAARPSSSPSAWTSSSRA